MTWIRMVCYGVKSCLAMSCLADWAPVTSRWGPRIFPKFDSRLSRLDFEYRWVSKLNPEFVQPNNMRRHHVHWDKYNWANFVVWNVGKSWPHITMFLSGKSIWAVSTSTIFPEIQTEPAQLEFFFDLIRVESRPNVEKSRGKWNLEGKGLCGLKAGGARLLRG